MRKLILTSVVLLAFAAGTSAQVNTPVSLYAGGALSMPSSEAFNAGWQMGYHGCAGVGWKAAPNLQVIGKMEYHHFFFDFADLLGIDGGATKMWVYGVDGRYSLGLPAVPLKPYVLGGVGLASISWSEFEGTSLAAAVLNDAMSESVTKMYFNIGAGLELKTVPGLSLFAQARWIRVATEGEAMSFVPVTLGVKLF
ncbi:MAG: outer membrane beta-barrel protein [Candidatus Zixiibacteriota bacterium]|nr:MAG: outer membrane beta-barrel protein [candidate division Zixibacteria bacterium]